MSQQHLYIDGPAGRIEAVWTDTEKGERAALICHPHPLYGGSMDDAVVNAVERAFLASDVSTLRFNFRGVGGSGGTHDRGVGEVDDVVCLLRWLEAEQGKQRLLLAGYSFGGGVALGAALRGEPEVAHLFLVAPALGRDAPGAAELPCALVLIQGEADRMVDGAAARGWAQRLSSPVELVPIPGADHFFGGALDDITAAINGRLA